jgi:CheY-like chemotaxis protein
MRKDLTLDTLPYDSFFKIVALTASPFEEQQADALSSGCDDFVRKPGEAEIFKIIGK